MAEQAQVAGAAVPLHTGARAQGLLGGGEDSAEFLAVRVGQALQVAGASGEGVVQDEVVAGQVGVAVGFGAGGGADVGRVAAVAQADAQVQGSGEGGEALVDLEGGGGQQDAQGLGAVLGGGDDALVVGLPGVAAAAGGAPWAVVGQVGASGQGIGECFLDGGVARFAFGRAAAHRAHGEASDGDGLSSERGVGPAPIFGRPEVEAPDDSLPDVLHTEGGLGVPPGLLDRGGVDVNSGRDGVDAAAAVVVIVDDPGVVALVT